MFFLHVSAAGDQPADTAVSSVAAEFDHAGSINEEYEFIDSQLVKKEEAGSGVVTKIGEMGSSEFKPDLTVSKWDGEVSFKVKPDISDVNIKDRDLEFEGGNIRYQTPAVDYLMYDMPEESANGGYEFAMVLNEKPDSNVLEENIETHGLEFYPQPPLNEEEQRPGLICSATQCVDVSGKVVKTRPGRYCRFDRDLRDW